MCWHLRATAVTIAVNREHPIHRHRRVAQHFAYRNGDCGDFWPQGITITSGQHGEGMMVPKVALISRAQVLLQEDRLHFAGKHPLIATLRQELLDMRVKMSPTSGRDTYEALTESAHDDLVVALCLAVLWPHRNAVCSRIDPTGARHVRDESGWGRGAAKG